jgi:predicted dehydrogenase
MSKLKIGFVGVGNMGQCAHLKNYVALPDCQVTAIAEIQPYRARRVAERYGIPKVYADHRAMLEAEQLDAIVASQPFTRHGVLLPDLYAAGVPIFTEKPLCGAIEVGEKLLAALAASPSWHMVGYHKRSDPATMAAKAEIDRLKATGELGKLRYVRVLMPAGDWVAGGFWDVISNDAPEGEVVWESPKDLQWDLPASDMDKETNDRYWGFVNYYIHQVNLLRHLLGAPYKVSYADPSGVMLAVQSDEGVAGVIEMTPYSTSVDWQESAFVCFEHGWIKLELPAPLAFNRPGRVEIYRDPGNGVSPVTEVPTLPWVHAMRQQAINFLRAVKGEIPPLCDAQEAMQDLQVARDYIRLLTGK